MKTCSLTRYALLLVLPFILFSCTVEKRHYRSGWYISGIDHKKQAQVNTTAAVVAQEKITTVSPVKEIPALAISENKPSEISPAPVTEKISPRVRKTNVAPVAARHFARTEISAKNKVKPVVAHANSGWKNEKRSKYFGILSGIMAVAALVSMALFAPVGLIIAMFGASLAALILHLSMRDPKAHPKPAPTEKKKKGGDGTGYAIVFLALWIIAALIIIGAAALFLSWIVAF